MSSVSCTLQSGYYKYDGKKWSFVPRHQGSKTYSRKSTPKIMNKASSSEISMVERARFRWPVPSSSRISSHFGKRGSRHHDGIDIPAKSGSHILASDSGEVVFSGWMRGYGRIIVLKHSSGYNTVYAHNSKNIVKKGEKVTKAQVIGKVGNSGRSTGSHLHYEIRKNKKIVNPMVYFEKKLRSLASSK